MSKQPIQHDGGTRMVAASTPGARRPATDVPVTVDRPGGGNPAARHDDGLACSTPARPAAATGRWWCAVIVSTIVSLPLAWVLSYAAALPFFIGVFFFALAGLIVGAIAHRIAAPARPLPPSHLVAGTTIVVLTFWSATVVKEARDFPSDMSKQAEGVRDIGDRTLAEFRAAVASEVREHVAGAYPPGGALGYVQWVVRDGAFERGELESVDKTLVAAQRGAGWIVRVALSVGLLAFGVSSQTLNLRLTREPSVRVIDAQ